MASNRSIVSTFKFDVAVLSIVAAAVLSIVDAAGLRSLAVLAKSLGIDFIFSPR